MTRELQSKNITTLTKKLQARYHIGQSQVYKRQKHLNITPIKEKNQGAWLTTEQLQQLDQLHEYLLSGQPIDNYQIPVVSIIAQPVVASVEETLVQDVPPQLEEIPTLLESSPHLIETEQVMKNDQVLDSIHKAAQSKAAGNLILTNLLAAEYQKHPELLEQHLLEAISKSQEVAAPKSINPMAYAEEMLRRLPIG
ncbi:hypothetical protein [Gloeothece verrucosa]|nr:hypothetical protein [Gloeothece verrucosa]